MRPLLLLAALALGADDASLPRPRDFVKLTDADIVAAAKTLDCEVALIRAVNEVESSGSGFFASKRPKILFEAHVFSRLTKHKYDQDHPKISSAKADRKLYIFGER